MTELYIITGASGFLGNTICCRLAAEGKRVRALVRSEKKAAALPANCEHVIGDVLDTASLEPLFAHSDGERLRVIHAAAVISVLKHDSRCYKVNVNGTRNMLALAEKHGASSFVYISSVDALHPAALVSEPDNFCSDGLPTDYARAKAVASRLVTEYGSRGLNCSLILPSCILGPCDLRRGFTTEMISMYLSMNVPVSITGGYEFVDVRDVADCAIKASGMELHGDAFIISNRRESMTCVFNEIADMRGTKRVRCELPAGLIYVVVPLVFLVWRLRGKQPPLSIEAVKLIKSTTLFNHSKATSVLGFKPIPLDATIRDMATSILDEKAAKRRHKNAGKE
ncbi:MAG TPA: NAD-dependent epimerase/dehydratase family protein [Eubacteriales bacterium]|nr:NAD-dependent epimerase/dehydratase family protein [Clostridia bacterium]HRV73010.1 NAD-dependent epimerase/dehydratase family protein [Eubacteriales bacterium]